MQMRVTKWKLSRPCCGREIEQYLVDLEVCVLSCVSLLNFPAPFVHAQHTDFMPTRYDSSHRACDFTTPDTSKSSHIHSREEPLNHCQRRTRTILRVALWRIVRFNSSSQNRLLSRALNISEANCRSTAYPFCALLNLAHRLKLSQPEDFLIQVATSKNRELLRESCREL